jgi:hypothetical protein
MHLESNSFPQCREKRNKSILDPYCQTIKKIKDYLEQANYQANWTYDRLKNMGYTGW